MKKLIALALVLIGAAWAQDSNGCSTPFCQSWFGLTSGDIEVLDSSPMIPDIDLSGKFGLGSEGRGLIVIRRAGEDVVSIYSNTNRTVVICTVELDRYGKPGTRRKPQTIKNE